MERNALLPVPTLPNGAYYRANTVGEGAFGSVMIVYNDDGLEFAAKRFEESDDGDMDIGTIREVGILRVLSQAKHPNIIPLQDMALIEEGGLVMIMPCYSTNLADAIESGVISKPKEQLTIIYYCLHALHYLHTQGIMHRDLKSDNIMLTESLQPVLIDFSLAKYFVDVDAAEKKTTPKKGKKAKKDARKAAKEKEKREATLKKELTGELGTACYTAPEIVDGESYNELADVWSMGVIVSEVLMKKVTEAEKDKEAFRHIREMKAKLKPEQPLTQLLLQMLEEDASKRATCTTALACIADLCEKAGLTEQPQAPQCSWAQAPRCCFETQKYCRAMADALEYSSRTRDMVELYAGYLEENGEKLSERDCLYLSLIAGKLLEVEIVDPWDLDEDWHPSFKRFDMDHFIQNEVDYCRRLDWNFFFEKK